VERAAGAGDLTASLLRQVSRSFYLSLAVLPSSLRPAVGLAYLLARAADTIADTRILPRETRIERLAALRSELAGPGPGRATAIVTAMGSGAALEAERELLDRLPECLAAHRALPLADRARVATLLGTIIEGMISDLTAFPGEDATGLEALPSRGALDRYTYLVAGCVGEFWTDTAMAHRARLHGWDGPRMKALGIRFGQGLQMTNILRDMPRDLRQGRCYLPREDLARLGLDPRDLLDPAARRAARPLLLELLRLTLDHYDAAWAYTLAIPVGEPRLRLACLWPLCIGLRTLALLARAGDWLDPAVVIKVPRAEVYALLARSALTVWLTPALAAEARRLRARVAA
jgi:farnesyl-diphosphate farnesyltransferase